MFHNNQNTTSSEAFAATLPPVQENTDTCAFCNKAIEDRPPQICQWCEEPYDPWLCKQCCKEDDGLFDELCEDCWLEDETGDEAWQLDVESWPDCPETGRQSKILFTFYGETGEAMWCTVLEHKGNGLFLVELNNASLFDEKLIPGVKLLASWDGEGMLKPLAFA